MKRWIGVAALVLLLACGGDDAAEQEEGAPVVVAPVRIGEIEERIGGTGELAAKERAMLAAEVDGQVTELRVDEGARVAEGDVLLRVDPEKRSLDAASARAQLRDAEASAVVARREYERVTSLHEKGIASDSQLDQRGTENQRAQSRLESMRAQLGVADKLLRDADVRAPFAGLVAQRLVSRGEYVRPGQALFELVSLDPIEVEFSVAERDSSRVAIGQPVAVQVEPFPGESFRGEVTVVSPVIDPKTRTLRVKAQVPNGDARLRPGLFARTDLGVAKRNGVVFVPDEAILQRADGEVVFVVSADDHVRRVVVKTGAQREDEVEIVDGLAAGDVVVVRGHNVLGDGQAISRRNEDGSQAGSSTKLATDGQSAGSAR